MKRIAQLSLALLALVGALGAANGPVQPSIAITAQEKAWIAAHPVIRVGHDPSFAPYALRDASGDIVGIDPDFLAIVSQRTGLQFIHTARASWEETLEAFKAREIDLLGSMGSSPERESYMTYSAVYTLAPNAIVTRNDTPYLLDLHELAGKTIGLPRGYAGLRNDLAENAPGYIPVEYDTTLDCYRAVSRGDVFATIGDVANAAYLVRTNRLNNLRLGSVTSASSEIFFGVRNDWPELTSLLNKSIASITPLERKQINDRWISIDYVSDHRWAFAFKVAAAIAAAALLIFAAAFWHNRRLSRELTERRRMQVELERVQENLQRANLEKSELMHMLAHDLRNPLTSVLMGVDLLRLGDLPREHNETVLRLRAHAQKMSRLIDDLMDANAIEAGQRRFAFGPVDVARTTRAAVEAFTDAAATKRLRLELSLPEKLVQVETDEGALRQVIDNVLSNAVKYSPIGQTVHVTLEENGGYAQIRVVDHGPGMTPAEVELLFRKFGRGQARPTAGEQSSGLGLWIARRVIEMLEGTVRCESEPGAGATFIVELPLRRRQAPRMRQ